MKCGEPQCWLQPLSKQLPLGEGIWYYLEESHYSVTNTSRATERDIQFCGSFQAHNVDSI